MSIATLTSKGQVTLPRDIRKKLHLEAGEKVEFRVDEKTGTAIMVALNKHVDDVFGMLNRKKRQKTLKIEEINSALKTKFRREYR